ncbi:MAG: GDSL family lipase [Chloroflexi bacterium]|nr:GDSL family lipase [Chloroflexota bacterium]
MQSIALNDPRLSWDGAVGVTHDPDGSRGWRMPPGERDVWHPELVLRAAMPAGVRIRFVTDATEVTGTVEAGQESSPIDIVADGRLVTTLPVVGSSSFRCDYLPAGTKVLEIWLPQFGPFAMTGLTLSEGATVSAVTDDGPRWVTYGSSITQCRAAPSPTLTWPAIVAREAGLNLTCLGYGGQCHLDIGVARLMRSLPASYISLCSGINIYGAASLGPRAFRTTLAGFVQIVREGHPVTPIALISPIWGVHRETEVNQVGFTLASMRDEVQAVVAVLRSRGDRHIHYVDGQTLFGASSAHLLPDDLHPNGEGYRVLASNFLTQVVEPYFRPARADDGRVPHA